MKAVVTFDNGQRIVAEIRPLVQGGQVRRPKFWAEWERDFVEQWNKSQPKAVHKVVKAHILRN